MLSFSFEHCFYRLERYRSRICRGFVVGCGLARLLARGLADVFAGCLGGSNNDPVLGVVACRRPYPAGSAGGICAPAGKLPADISPCRAFFVRKLLGGSAAWNLKQPHKAHAWLFGHYFWPAAGKPG